MSFGSYNHGLSKTPEYHSWHGMKARCHNPTNKAFHMYGGRGIKVWIRWRENFISFLVDMGPRPSELHSVERLDTDGDYDPGNCSWATDTDQNRNRGSYNVRVPFDGRLITVGEWASITGGVASRVYHRLSLGWEPETAISFPKDQFRVLKRERASNGS